MSMPAWKKNKNAQFKRSMNCPECGCNMLMVTDSRSYKRQIRRRRLCQNGHKFTTYERFVDDINPIPTHIGNEIW